MSDDLKVFKEDLKTLSEYTGKLWRTTEPGSRWAYVFSIIGALLSVLFQPSYIHSNTKLMYSLLIPAALLSWVKGGLPFRLIWLGFVTLFILIWIDIIFRIFQLFHNLIMWKSFYISLFLVISALVMGFKSFNVKKISELFLEKAPMRLFAVIYLLIIISYLIDFLFMRYLSYMEHIETTTITFSFISPFFMVVLYIFLTESIERRHFIGTVLSPIMAIAIAVPWLIWTIYRLNVKFMKLFFEDLNFLIKYLNLNSLWKVIILVKAIVTLAFPILLIIILIYFFKSIWDSIPPKSDILKAD